MFINPPTFFIAPTVAMLPKSVGIVPILSLNLSIFLIIVVKKSITPLAVSDVTKPLTKSVQVLESLLSEPSQLLAVFSHNIQYHSQYGISC